MDNQDNDQDIALGNMPGEVGPEVGKPTTPITPKRRGGGPRTAAGKAKSRRNALRTGFHAKHILDDPLFSETKRQFLQVGRQLIKEFEPVGVFDFFHIEFAAWNMVQYRRLIEYWQALVLERNTREVPDLSYLATLETIRLQEEEAPGPKNTPNDEREISREEEVERRLQAKYAKEFAQAEALAKKHAYIQAIKNGLPTEADYEWFHRVATRLLGNVRRAQRDLERSHYRKTGASVPPARRRELLHD